jgi:DNA-binding NtrC family response regulator
MAVPERPILIIDEDSHGLTALKATLCSAGLTNVVGSTSQYALTDLLKSSVYSLVVIDISVPCPAGLGAIDRAASLEAKPPLLIITASRREGCPCFLGDWRFDCLMKPVDRETLLRAIHSAVERPVGAARNHGLRAARRKDY